MAENAEVSSTTDDQHNVPQTSSVRPVCDCSNIYKLLDLQNIYHNKWQGVYLNGYIQAIGFTPFSIAAYTEKQINIIERFSKYDMVTLNFDSIDGIVAPPEWIGEPLSYHALIMDVHGQSCNFPVAEFITSEINQTSMIHFLMGFNENIKKVTERQIVSTIEANANHSILESLAKAFTDMDLASYIKHCWDFMTTGISGSFDLVHIRISNRHIFNLCKTMISRFTAYGHLRNLAEIFVKHLMKTTHIREAANAIHCGFILFESENKIAFEDQLLQAVLGGNFFSLPNPNSLLISVEAGDTYKDQSPFYQIFFAQSEATINSLHLYEIDGHKNPYALPGFMFFIIKHLSPYYPLWSASMINEPMQGTGYENDNENSWIERIKNFDSRQMLPAGRFIRHCERLLTERLNNLGLPQ